ncbi:PE family protein [Mycobacterium persicum]|uniref:PE family protein PE3 n=1 Tax=Mycobacterium persicum TaxID=1487726 RepID=A0AB38ULY6_9MYCO|nr:PE-PPE domain-containing protein [Mycobacterium persicum]ORB92899.1 PE family protein [Mycobacterium persicum]VAZ81496.1 PE family protein PE3 [Mycobacterium persicum]
MSYVLTQPPAMVAAAAELAGIGSAINEAAASVAGPTTTIATAAADEVSTAIAQLFGAFGQEYQAINAQLGTLYSQFTQKLTAAANAYFGDEAISAASLVKGATAGLFTPTSPTPVPPGFGQNTAIVMSGTGSPIPSIQYVTNITNLFLPPGVVVNPLNTIEELYPITGVKSLPFQNSVQTGLQILDAAIWEQIHAGNHVTVFGYSQSAVISSLEIEQLLSLGPNKPDPSQLSFIFIGNEMNPNGGILSRIPGLNISTLGLPFYGSTPDNPYPTTTYTLEYDGFADFPRYPLNVLSDINAVFGIITVHTQYPYLTSQQVANAILLPTEGVTSNQYYIIETADLPLLAPIRAIPVIGPPLAALVQPNLEVIVNLGYGDPRFGYSTSPANIPTPFGLFPDIPPGLVVDALVAGTQQGINDFAAALPAALNPPELPVIGFPPFIQQILPPSPTPVPATPVNIASTFAAVVADSYSLLLPTADLGVAFATILPAYDLSLFLNQLLHGNFIAAIELPLAATAGLAALGSMIEFIAIVRTIASIIQQLQSLSF